CYCRRRVVWPSRKRAAVHHSATGNAVNSAANRSLRGLAGAIPWAALDVDVRARRCNPQCVECVGAANGPDIPESRETDAIQTAENGAQLRTRVGRNVMNAAAIPELRYVADIDDVIEVAGTAKPN